MNDSSMMIPSSIFGDKSGIGFNSSIEPSEISFKAPKRGKNRRRKKRINMSDTINLDQLMDSPPPPQEEPEYAPEDIFVPEEQYFSNSNQAIIEDSEINEDIYNEEQEQSFEYQEEVLKEDDIHELEQDIEYYMQDCFDSVIDDFCTELLYIIDDPTYFVDKLNEFSKELAKEVEKEIEISIGRIKNDKYIDSVVIPYIERFNQEIENAGKYKPPKYSNWNSKYKLIRSDIRKRHLLIQNHYTEMIDQLALGVTLKQEQEDLLKSIQKQSRQIAKAYKLDYLKLDMAMARKGVEQEYIERKLTKLQENKSLFFSQHYYEIRIPDFSSSIAELKSKFSELSKIHDEINKKGLTLATIKKSNNKIRDDWYYTMNQLETTLMLLQPQQKSISSFITQPTIDVEEKVDDFSLIKAHLSNLQLEIDESLNNTDIYINEVKMIEERFDKPHPKSYTYLFE